MATDDAPDPVLHAAISSLGDSQPASDLWPGIARQLTPRHPRGTVLLRWPAALAAGLAIAALTSAGTILVLHQHQAARVDSAALSAVAPPPMISASFAAGDATLAHAIADLEQVVRARLATQDPKSRAAVDLSLAELDRAIAQAAARQTAAPDDPRAARYLTSTLRKKLDVLRTVVQLTASS